MPQALEGCQRVIKKSEEKCFNKISIDNLAEEYFLSTETIKIVYK